MLVFPDQEFLTFVELAQRWRCEESYIKYLVESEQLKAGDKYAALRGKRKTLFISMDPQNPYAISDIVRNENDAIVTVRITDNQVPFWDEIMQIAKDRTPESSISVVFMTDIHRFESQHNSIYLIADDLVIGKRQQQIAKIIEVIKFFSFEPLNIPDKGKSKIKVYCLNKFPKLFTSESFNTAWKEGRKDDLFKMENHEKYLSE